MSDDAFDFPEDAVSKTVATPQRPLTVTELTRQLKRTIESQFLTVYVEGELSGVKPAASGHVYFTLKDQKAVISCVMWAAEAALLTQPLREGDKVELRGRLTVYEARGNYQIIVQSVRPAGIGKLFVKFQELKERLEREGLFAPERKRAIPTFPRAVGIVTSPSGAAIQDILNVMGRRAPHIHVIIFPARVQGAGAATEIAYGITRMNALRMVDVLIVARGGGSLEDLWSFNEEIVARAVFRSDIPVISAVGHEVDFTICDFVADFRAPTPSAAAELVSRNASDSRRELVHLRNRVLAAIRQRLEPLRDLPHLRQRLENAVLPRIDLLRSHVRRFDSSHALQLPLHRVNLLRQELDEAEAVMYESLRSRHQELTSRLHRVDAQLRALSPTSILQRGYSITFDTASGEIIKSEKQVHIGQALKIRLNEGCVNATAGNDHTPAPRRRPRRQSKPTPLEWFGTNPLAALGDCEE